MKNRHRDNCSGLNKMEKRVQPTSQFALEKCNKRRKYQEVHINKLPDDILVSILSLLTMKDASRSSALSRRWRYLWTFTTGTFEFDDYKKVRDTANPMVRKAVEAERPRFVGWVNQVLKSHRGPTLDGLKVLFDMDDKSFERDINDWLKSAIEKRVKWLELDFTCYWGHFIRRNYALTLQIFGNSQFGSLTSLRLACVDVTGEDLEYFFSNCPFLEVLCISTSMSLVHLKIFGPSLKLKYIKITRCHKLKTLEIYAINLISFIYCGPKINMPFKNVPRLREVSFSGGYANFVAKNFCEFSSCHSQLETLQFNLALVIEPSFSFPEFPELRNLKHLDLQLSAFHSRSLLHCKSLLKASPSLTRLVIKLCGLDAVSKQEKVKVWRSKRPHQCLKVVELVGFVGCKIDVELALYMLKNSVSLEKIIIDPRCVYDAESGSNITNPEKKLTARTRARLLERRLRPGVELVIL